MAGQTVIEDLVVRGTKLLDIGISGSFFFAMALATVITLNNIWPVKGEKEELNKSKARLVLEIVAKVWLISCLAYIVRNFWTAIPFPLEGIYGYKHLKTGEVTSSAVFAAFAVTFDTQLQAKVKTLKAKMNL
jgi:hypothetical protein